MCGELCSGATLYLPVLNRGALFSAGDAHAAQGDGEVCINGIECPADVTLRFRLHKKRALAGTTDRIRQRPGRRTGWARRGSWWNPLPTRSPRPAPQLRA